MNVCRHRLRSRPSLVELAAGRQDQPPGCGDVDLVVGDVLRATDNAEPARARTPARRRTRSPSSTRSSRWHRRSPRTHVPGLLCGVSGECRRRGAGVVTPAVRLGPAVCEILQPQRCAGSACAVDGDRLVGEVSDGRAQCLEWVGTCGGAMNPVGDGRSAEYPFELVEVRL